MLIVEWSESVTDAGVASLAASRLRELELGARSITDTALDHLGALATLRRLDLAAPV